ncbi:MAG: hypothetical protein CMO97_03515 [Woeseia sp.]|nr:hypothetical protein [Woeseia sp.]|tara:strand:+ start:4465 stop:5409 length:945 start_codon:yes stop_codon:yes gene_type:complete
MSSEKDKTSKKNTPDITKNVNNQLINYMAGELLAKSRRELKISLSDIAKELHLDESRVTALERNDFRSLGAPVFAKGHLRKYAKIVNVDEVKVVADYCELTEENDVPPLVISEREKYKNISLKPLYLGLIIVSVIVALYFFLTNQDIDSKQSSIESVKPFSSLEELNMETSPNIMSSNNENEIIESNQDIFSTNDQLAEEKSNEEESLEDQFPEIESPQEPYVEQEDITLMTETQINIIYSGDCWTEISDANGNRLFFDLARADSIVELSGIAPFDILFGDVASVSLLIDGEPFNIAESDRRSNNTARVTISGL